MKLYYFMGASGSGKDSLLQAVRQQFDGELLVAPRYITRASDAGGENHIALSVSEFRLRQRLGLFAMHWQANGLHYGIGQEVHHWLASGVAVLVNGSRGYYPQAKALFGQQLQGIWVQVNPDTLARRLVLRGRESAAEIADRMARHATLQPPPGQVVCIDNNGSLANSLDQLIQQTDIWQGAVSQ